MACIILLLCCYVAHSCCCVVAVFHCCCCCHYYIIQLLFSCYYSISKYFTLFLLLPNKNFHLHCNLPLNVILSPRVSFLFLLLLNKNFYLIYKLCAFINLSSLLSYLFLLLIIKTSYFIDFYKYTSCYSIVVLFIAFSPPDNKNFYLNLYINNLSICHNVRLNLKFSHGRPELAHATFPSAFPLSHHKSLCL